MFSTKTRCDRVRKTHGVASRPAALSALILTTLLLTKFTVPVTAAEYTMTTVSIDPKDAGSIEKAKKGYVERFVITTPDSSYFKLNVKVDEMALRNMTEFNLGLEVNRVYNNTSEIVNYTQDYCSWLDTQMKRQKLAVKLMDGSYTKPDSTVYSHYYYVAGDKPKARVVLKLTSMSKPFIKEYNLPFEITPYEQRSPVTFILEKRKTRDKEEVDHFEVYDRIGDNHVIIGAAVWQEMGNNREPGFELAFSHNHQKSQVNYLKSTVKEMVANAKKGGPKVIVAQECAKLKKDDFWVNVSLVAEDKPLVRVEVKMPTDGKPVIKEYPMPFTL